MQVIEPLTEKTWGRGWVVLVVRTKWRGTFAEHSIRFTVYENWVLWYGLGSIITISVCNLFNSTRFILSIPDTLLTFCFTRVSWHPNQLWRKSFRRRMKEWPRIKTRIGGIKKKKREYIQRKYLPEKILLVIWLSWWRGRKGRITRVNTSIYLLNHDTAAL